MKNYSSSSSFAFFESILLSTMVLGIGIILSNSIEIIEIQAVIITISIILSLLIILYQRKRVFEIQFKDEFVEIEFIYTKRKLQVPYSELLTVEYISVYKYPTKNKIEFKLNKKRKKLKFLTIANSNDYVEFIKWLKSKNENIEWRVFPSDNIMNHKLQEIYGFKYRKN